MDQDQLNPYVAYEGYVVRVPHNAQYEPIPVKYELKQVVYTPNLVRKYVP